MNTILLKQKIKVFLDTNHKRAWCMDDKMLDAWLSQALDNIENHYPYLELKSYETNNKQTMLLNLEN